MANIQRIVDPLPDDSIVIRGGVMNLADLRESAAAHRDEMARYDLDEWALSINSLAGQSVEQIAKKAKLRYGKIRVSTVGRIRTQGLEVRPDGRKDGHGNIVFLGEPGDEDLVKLCDAFDDPIDNPYPRGRRRRR